MNTLMTSLRDLKLEGMKASLQALVDQGDRRLVELSAVLNRLVEAEMEHRRILGAERLVKRAHFRYQASIQSIATGVERNIDSDTVARLAEGLWIKQGHNLLVTGPTGSGKSYLISALGRQACLQGYSTLYFSCGRLWSSMAQSRKRDTLGQDLKNIARTELLILDDFGLGKLDALDRLCFLEILEDRWGRAATIVASQRPLSTWHEVLGEPTVADAICDRLFSNAEKIELKGESLRRLAMKP